MKTIALTLTLISGVILPAMADPVLLSDTSMDQVSASGSINYYPVFVRYNVAHYPIHH